MKNSVLVRSLFAVVALACATSLKAANVGADNAGNYAAWTNGSNGGTGFLPWDLTGSNNNGTSLFAGYFLGDSTQGSGNINTGTQSFAIYANPGGAFARAARSFAGGALTPGQTFTLQLAVNFRNGGKGFNLYDGNGQFLNFNVGSVNGTDGYYYTVGSNAAVNTNFAYQADSVFTLAYTQQSATNGLFTITRTSVAGGPTATNTVSVPITTSGVNAFVLYNSNTDSGNPANNLYFNNLAVTVPEPSVCVLAAVGGTALAVMRRRRK